MTTYHSEISSIHWVSNLMMAMMFQVVMRIRQMIQTTTSRRIWRFVMTISFMAFVLG